MLANKMIANMPLANVPHKVAPQTLGELAGEIIQLISAIPSADEIDQLLKCLGNADNQTIGALEMKIGDVPITIGIPGTWASVNKKSYRFSPYVAGVLDSNNMPADPTVADRVAEMLRTMIVSNGGKAEWVQNVTAAPDAFSKESDKIEYDSPCAPSGRHWFIGSFSHNRAFSPANYNRLESAAHEITTQHRRADQVREKIAFIRNEIIEKYSPMGMTVGETYLIGVEENNGDVIVETTTHVETIGQALEPTYNMIARRHPHALQRDEVDMFKRAANRTKKALAILNGRNRFEAMTVCSIFARYALSLAAGEREVKITQIKQAVEGKNQSDEVYCQMGMLVGNAPISDNITYYPGRLKINDLELPFSVLSALSGKDVQHLVRHPFFKGLKIKKAWKRAEGVTVSFEKASEPLLPFLAKMGIDTKDLP